jgi:maleate isomerase
MNARRIGLLVPSSNTTMEIEVPEVLRRVATETGEQFTFHSARMRMKQVSADQLAAMNADADRATVELADADVDVMAYACLVAIMSQGPGAHREIEERLAAAAAADGAPVDIVSSAGALVDGLHHIGARKVSLVTPYLKPLTQSVVEYIEGEGIEVQDAISLEVDDNLEVGRLDSSNLPEIAQRLDTTGVDAVVLSACVQMPSLQAITATENALGLPAITASTATAWKLLSAIGAYAPVPDAGALFRA